jgi:hypothetical protein
MDFRIKCLACNQATKYDALDDSTGLVCDKCGANL